MACLLMTLLIRSRVKHHRYKFQTEKQSSTKRGKSLKIYYLAKGNIKLRHRMVVDLILLKEVSR